MYLLLKPAIENREPEELVVDEVFKIIDLASPQSLLASLHIMYDNKVRANTPMEFNELFMRGIAECRFLEFCAVIRGLNGSSE